MNTRTPVSPPLFHWLGRKQVRLGLALLGSVALAFAGGTCPGSEWETIAHPAQAGWSEAQLEAARQCARTMTDSIGGMAIAGGKIVFQWGNVTQRGNVESVRKSLLSSLIGIYADEGKLDLHASLAELGINDREPALTEAERGAKVVDLLQCRSGVYHPAAWEDYSMRADRPARGSHEPGTFWFYNNWDCNALGTIFERQTGVTIGSAFEAKIAEPIGMQDFRARDVSHLWGRESDHPAYPCLMTARDMARFGLLYLRGGEWNGRQILPRPWIETSVSAHSDCAGRGPVARMASPSFTVGYGYLWWVYKYRRPDTGAELSAFGAEGNGGQAIRIYPARDMVIVNVTNFEETGIDSRAKFEALARILLGAPGKSN